MNRFPDAKEVAVIREHHFAAWRGLGARHVPDFAQIVARYSEGHRAYHTLVHLMECLRWLAASRELAESPFEVALALIYHDLVYDPRRADNEKRSAALFRSCAHASHLPAAFTAWIAALIEGTASHRAQGGDAALVNDIDLAVLGASPHAFARYEAQIREEHRHLDDAIFRAGRARVVRAFLESTSIYATRFFNQRLEAQARTNLSQSLSALREAEPLRKA